MNQNSEHGRNTSFANVMKYFGIVMALLYVVAGVSMLVQSDRLFDIPRNYAIALGIGLIGYGLFRGYRLYQKYFQNEST